MSINWNDARLLDQICYDLVLGDLPRGDNRARVANLANGGAPFTEAQVERNKININVNDLSMTRSLQEARSSFYNAFIKPGNFFTCRTDYGPRHKREEWGIIVSKEINRVMKRSIQYFEQIRSKVALLILHGIGPSTWENRYSWRPRPLGVDDVLIPSGTYIGFENLPFFVLRRQFTAIELLKLTRKEKRDPGWKMNMVEAAITWCDSQAQQLMNNNFPDTWAPEKWEERIKEGGCFASDQVPVIDTFDIYGYVDDGDHSGWVRRVILDSWGSGALSGGKWTLERAASKDTLKPQENDFLYSSGNRTVAESWQNVLTFQYADLSAVAPYRYHSVRSLGWLNYAICHLQNRLHCKFQEAVFENLMMLFKVKSMDDVQRAMKVNLFNQGFFDESMAPVPANERWQVNENLALQAFARNERQISSSTGSFAQRRDFNQDNKEKTRYQVMAEVHADTAMIGSALMQAYMYQQEEDREIFRRFMRRYSRDPEVNSFRAACLSQGVSSKVMEADCWEIEHERIMGGGNKTLELQIAEKLMEWRPMYDPEPQRDILRSATLALTDDPAKARSLVPPNPVKVTDSVHDAQLATGTIMQGLPVAVKTGINHIEYAETLLSNLALLVRKADMAGKMVSAEELQGMENLARHIAQHIQIIAQDEKQKSLVKELSEALAKLMNEIRAFRQRLAEAMKKQAQQNGNGHDPAAIAKVQATMMQAQAKIQQGQKSHAEKTAQRRISFEQKMEQDQKKAEFELQKEKALAASELAREDVKTAQEIRHNSMRHAIEGDDDE